MKPGDLEKGLYVFPETERLGSLILVECLNRQTKLEYFAKGQSTNSKNRDILEWWRTLMGLPQSG